MSHAISIELPEELYERIQQIATRSQSSLEMALLEGMSWLYTTVPSDRAATFKKLRTLSEVRLWAVVYQRLHPRDDARLQSLSDAVNQAELPAEKQAEMEVLLRLVDYQMLLRSEALLLLKQRGHDAANYVSTSPSL